jgi:hypothetical protein
MPGPLPSPNARRRNAPTIPTTDLPAEGRKGRAPACPYKLGKAGAAWWRWAWKLPQACGWSPGDLYVVARRARLEDDEQTSATLREARELDDRLGLTPKGMGALRWRIVEKPAADAPVPAATVSDLAERRARIAGANAS